ncbi:uncharacterized protein TrAFT101_001368 [Trichoderma asperellum]|uniref:uncharacterized protein n=1 Tax=Trichoderma asperellum TaxID=101201 RepID=UPI00332B0F92|nr:hypothetical protein TrAFT101_001368 [Trichoderma asperellum]
MRECLRQEAEGATQSVENDVQCSISHARLTGMFGAGASTLGHLGSARSIQANMDA